MTNPRRPVLVRGLIVAVAAWVGVSVLLAETVGFPNWYGWPLMIMRQPGYPQPPIAVVSFNLVFACLVAAATWFVAKRLISALATNFQFRLSTLLGVIAALAVLGGVWRGTFNYLGVLSLSFSSNDNYGTYAVLDFTAHMIRLPPSILVVVQLGVAFGMGCAIYVAGVLLATPFEQRLAAFDSRLRQWLLASLQSHNDDSRAKNAAVKNQVVSTNNPATRQARPITDSARHILRQIPDRAADRGLHVVDESTLPMLVLWSILLWERKVGRSALDWIGVEWFRLVCDLDKLLTEKAKEHPIAFDPERNMAVFAKSREPYHSWYFDSVVEPLLGQSQREAASLRHDYIGSEHLVLAVISLADPMLLEVLRRHHIDHPRSKQAILEILQG